jgi:hypothetical protein
MTNFNNKIMAEKLNKVSFCLAMLEARGATVTSIEISNTKPILTIQTIAREPFGLKGGLFKREFKGGKPWEGYAAEFEGCQVQWMLVPELKQNKH